MVRNQEPVPQYSRVLRLARLPKDYLYQRRVSAIQLEPEFELSSGDKVSVPIHLSVWVEGYTTPQQAYSFLEGNSPRRLVLRLNVDEIRAIKSCPLPEQTYSDLLDVLWIQRQIDNPDGTKQEDYRPGAKGHSGIVGLDDGALATKLADNLTNRQRKNLRKDLRAQLAELASKDVWSLDA